MATPRVLLLGGHGKISLHLTPLLLARSWNVTSVVRNADHKDEILKLGDGKKGKVDVLVSSLDDIKSETDAGKVLDQVKPEYVVWSAGNLISPIDSLSLVSGGLDPPSPLSDPVILNMKFTIHKQAPEVRAETTALTPLTKMPRSTLSQPPSPPHPSPNFFLSRTPAVAEINPHG